MIEGMKKIEGLKGMRDFYPDKMKLYRGMNNVIHRVMKSYGYLEYDAPILERMELYTAKTSEEIVKEQTYMFEDRGGREVVMRPEMTPSLARMVAVKQQELPPILRWYTVANCFRYERPQKGRLRSFFQFNLDVLGSSTPEAVAETIIVSLKVLEVLGADMERVKVKVADRGVWDRMFEEAGVSPSGRAEIIRLIDKKNKMEVSLFESKLEEICGDSEVVSKVMEVMEMNSIPSGDGYDFVREVVNIVSEAGYGDQIEFDPTIVRGFDYYTGVVYEIFESSGEYGRSIFGGGQYDNLVESYGGDDMPAVGCAASLVSIEEMFEVQGREILIEEDVSVMVIPYSQGEVSVASSVADSLRSGGVDVIFALPPYEVKKQLKLADRYGVDKVYLVTPEELRDGKVVVKDMKSGEQETVLIEEL